MHFSQKMSDKDIITVNVNQFDFDNISLNFICSVVTKLRHFTSAEIIDQEDKMQVTSSECNIMKKVV